MNAALAGLLSGAAYGVGDFLSGLASRTDPALRVVALSHPVSAVVLAGVAALLGQPLAQVADLMWGGAAGLVGLVAVLAFYRALALGPMGAVSVAAGALSAAVPVVVGVFGGESLGVTGAAGGLAVLTGTTLLSVTGGGRTRGYGVPLGVFAGVGFGLFFVLLGQAQGRESALWTLATARLASSAVAVPVAVRTVGLRPRQWKLIAASMPGDALGNHLYLMSVQGGGLAIGALLSSLYPAVTTLLAVTVLRERLRPLQWLGLGVALLGAVLLSAK